ncbi:RHS repeat-associated core domain-containing protein, partial [Candidatus Gracilibacteria bacterium]|nr:RHS repeat-associated core domain-containing protein [Candidatus Gracilibacteria bacterium]
MNVLSNYGIFSYNSRVFYYFSIIKLNYEINIIFISEYKTIGVATGSGGTGVLTPLTLKKNYINGIGTDALIAYEVEEQLTATGLTKTTNRYYYHLNQLGSVVAISTQAGNMPRTFGYDAFGKAYILGEKTITEATYKDISSYTGTLYGNTRLYTGREYDQETGLYYNRARYYNSDTGRFISRDPIGQNDQVNLYTYVANSPLKYVDRNGKEKKFIKNNEGNAWYFEREFLTNDPYGAYAHAMLYFVYKGKEYSISFGP